MSGAFRGEKLPLEAKPRSTTVDPNSANRERPVDLESSHSVRGFSPAPRQPRLFQTLRFEPGTYLASGSHRTSF